MGMICNSYHPEIWGGLECTINRIGDVFRNQLEYTGHYNRDDDIEKIAQLGIKKLRYPVLWEVHQYYSTNEEITWKRTKKHLERIRSLRIDPIAGLMHHGSGPLFTNLLDDHFSEKLAVYAAKVAEKFPWLEYYTPVNEPLTTARFSGLYGYWYPHLKNELSFFKMFLNQLKGIVLSMQEIRKINPSAKLIQTEDLAEIHSTDMLQYQANFENNRKWLTYDLLCGKVNKEHFFWNYFISLGIGERSLHFFQENSCSPDIAGFNYYVTSERFLDEKVHLYPKSLHGGNGRQTYVDTTAARSVKLRGLKSLLEEAWERYKLPLALTEVHISCTREEQMRWVMESWETCCELRRKKINMQAITVWSMLGASDWDSLLTREDKNYESGVFEIDGNFIRPTALTKLIHSLASTGDYEHPLIIEKGWWHKSYPAYINTSPEDCRPLLILESDEKIGNLVCEICKKRSMNCFVLHVDNRSIFKEIEIEDAIKEYSPWAIVTIGSFPKTYISNNCGLNLILTDKVDDDLFKNRPGTLIVYTTAELNFNFLKGSFDLSKLINRIFDLLIDEETGLYFVKDEKVEKYDCDIRHLKNFTGRSLEVLYR